MTTGYVMKVSSNGQVSIPAEARARWGADRVVIVDLGDRVVVRPLPRDPVGDLVGRYRDRGPSADATRHRERDVAIEMERRKTQ